MGSYPGVGELARITTLSTVELEGEEDSEGHFDCDAIATSLRGLGGRFTVALKAYPAVKDID